MNITEQATQVLAEIDAAIRIKCAEIVGWRETAYISIMAAANHRTRGSENTKNV